MFKTTSLLQAPPSAAFVAVGMNALIEPAHALDRLSATLALAP
ncbi:hypothetical protein [Aquabacterium olei]|nr:hypothetical protein [Aquabacterium olei]